MSAFEWRITLTVACFGFVLAAPLFAEDECIEIAKSGPNTPSERVPCEMTGMSNNEAVRKPLNGLVQCKNTDNKIVREARFVKGDLTTLWFYDYGDRKLIFNFTKGKKVHGPAKVFTKDGKLLCEMNYANSKSDGAVRQYFQDGQLEKLVWYKDGQLQGAPSIEYLRKDKLSILKCPSVSVTPEDKVLCGFNGKPVTVKVYDADFYNEGDETVTHLNGLLLERFQLGSSDKLPVRTVYPEPGNRDTYNHEELHKNGSVFRKFSVKNNKKEGKYQEYADNGKLILEKEYKNDASLAENSFYMNGKVKENSVRNPYGNSVSTKEYWDNGKLKSIGVYFFKSRGYYGGNSVPTGKTFKYTETGALREEANYDEEGKLDGRRIQIDEKEKRTESVYRKGTLTARKVFTPDGKLESSEEYYEDGSRK